MAKVKHKYFKFKENNYSFYNKHKKEQIKTNQPSLWSEEFSYQEVHSIIKKNDLDKVGYCHDGEIYAHWEDNIMALVVEDDVNFGGMIVECAEILSTLSVMRQRDPSFILESEVEQRVYLHDKCNYYRTNSN